MSDDVKLLPTIVAGEIPEPLEVTFTKDGSALDLTGYSGRWEQRNPDGSVHEKTTSAVVVASDQTTDTGKVTVTFAEGDFDQAGRYAMELWIGNGTNRFAKRFRLTAEAANKVPDI